MKLSVLTHSPSPYQVELFNEIVARSDIDLTILYLMGSDPQRRWKLRPVRHEAHILTDRAALEVAMRLVREAELTVFNYYNNGYALRLLRRRVATGKPWLFWGERPGYRLSGAAGRIIRRWRLRDLVRSRAGIWGIGNSAVAAYKREFGGGRIYENVPYFSDLSRFRSREAAPRSTERSGRSILYSGELSIRKGLDLLASAFCRLAGEFPRAKLTLLGEGPLRNKLHRLLAPVREQVQFLGFKDWEEVPSVYAKHDFLCVPSRHDGWGLVVPEGLAAGLPVIGSDRTGAALDLIQPSVNGWLVRAAEVAELEMALTEALSISPPRIEEMREAARTSVENHTLANGAARFISAARTAVASWGA